MLFLVAPMATSFVSKKTEVTKDKAEAAAIFENSEGYINELSNYAEDEINYGKLKKYYLNSYYPLVSENQTSSDFCWIYSSLKCLETSFMVQKNEYFNFSEIGTAYMYYDYRVKNRIYASDSSSIPFNLGGNFTTFVSAYQNSGLVLESDFSNTEFSDMYSMSLSSTSNVLDYYDYVSDYATTEYNSIIKPYEIYNKQNFNKKTTISAKAEVIKAFVKKYGGLFVGIDGGNNVGCFYKESNETTSEDGIIDFYDKNRTSHQNQTESGYEALTGNHAVTIIGWNDEVKTGSKTGAFLALNSWGFETGDVNNLGSRTLFYIPYEYEGTYDTVCGFILDDDTNLNVTVKNSSDSSFTTDILTGSKKINNFYGYNDDIEITYSLNTEKFVSSSNIKAKIVSGSVKNQDVFDVSYNDADGEIIVRKYNGLTSFYGGYYTVNFYNDNTLIAKRGIYIYSGTEIGNFRVGGSSLNDGYALNNAFANNNGEVTLSASAPNGYYFMYFNLSPISDYNLFEFVRKDLTSWKGISLEITDVNVTNTTNSTLETKFTKQELIENLFYLNFDEKKNVSNLQIGVGKKLSDNSIDNTYMLYDFGNSLVTFKIKFNSVVYSNCSREYIVHLFVSERPNAATSNLKKIRYELNGGENSEENITKYPNYTRDTNFTEVILDRPTKENSNFLGWYTTADFSGEVITKIDANLSDNLTLYARWESIGIDYFNIMISREGLRNEETGVKDKYDSIVYGDTVTFGLNFEELTTLAGKQYNVRYYFYVLPNELSGTKSSNSGNFMVKFDYAFPNLQAGINRVRAKVIVDISGNLSIEKETEISINVLKKDVSFTFSELEKEYNGLSQKPKVQFNGFYEIDLTDENGTPLEDENLFVLKCDNETINVGRYLFYISEILNKNYKFDENTSKDYFEITKKGITLSWKNTDLIFTYDGENHFPEYLIDGLVDGDEISFNYTITECKNVGIYPINLSLDTISNQNYKVLNSLDDITVTIQKAVIQIIMHNATDRIQTLSQKRVVPTFTVIGSIASVADLQLTVVTEAKTATKSGVYPISCKVDNQNYQVELIKPAKYTLTGYYYVYYQLANGNSYAERVEEGEKPVGVTKKQLGVSAFSKIEYSDDYQVTGDDIYVAVKIKDYSPAVYSAIFVVVFAAGCLIYYLKKRGSSVR